MDTMRAFCLQVNFSEGKTEGLVNLAGKGATEAQHALWKDPIAGVPTLLLSGGQRLRVVTKYKHLGVLVAGSAMLDQECSARVASGRTATIALGRGVFSSRHLDDSIKAHVAFATPSDAAQ